MKSHLRKWAVMTATLRKRSTKQRMNTMWNISRHTKPATDGMILTRLTHRRKMPIFVLPQLLPICSIGGLLKNTDNIKEYLTLHPDAPRADEIRKFLTPVTSQEEQFSFTNILFTTICQPEEGLFAGSSEY